MRALGVRAGASACLPLSLSLPLCSQALGLDSLGSFCQVSPWGTFLSRAIFTALRALSPNPARTERHNRHLPGIEALQRSALTSALPRAESSDVRDDRAPPPGDDATEPVFPPAPAAAATAPPNTLVFDSTLSSERRPSTRPSDVAGEGRAFSVVAVASVGRFVWECRKRTSGKKRSLRAKIRSFRERAIESSRS